MAAAGPALLVLQKIVHPYTPGHPTTSNTLSLVVEQPERNQFKKPALRRNLNYINVPAGMEVYLKKDSIRHIVTAKYGENEFILKLRMRSKELIAVRRFPVGGFPDVDALTKWKALYDEESKNVAAVEASLTGTAKTRVQRWRTIELLKYKSRRMCVETRLQSADRHHQTLPGGMGVLQQYYSNRALPIPGTEESVLPRNGRFASVSDALECNILFMEMRLEYLTAQMQIITDDVNFIKISQAKAEKAKGKLNKQIDYIKDYPFACYLCRVMLIFQILTNDNGDTVPETWKNKWSTKAALSRHVSNAHVLNPQTRCHGETLTCNTCLFDPEDEKEHMEHMFKAHQTLYSEHYKVYDDSHQFKSDVTLMAKFKSIDTMLRQERGLAARPDDTDWNKVIQTYIKEPLLITQPIAANLKAEYQSKTGSAAKLLSVI